MIAAGRNDLIFPFFEINCLEERAAVALTGHEMKGNACLLQSDAHGFWVGYPSELRGRYRRLKRANVISGFWDNPNNRNAGNLVFFGRCFHG